MNFVGTWQSTAFSDRLLIFLDDGTGHIQVQGEAFPFFKWWVNDSSQLTWHFFSDPDMSIQLSQPHDARCEILSGGAELVFAHAPIPFGIKHFKRSAGA